LMAMTASSRYFRAGALDDPSTSRVRADVISPCCSIARARFEPAAAPM
jgi:hypothetical protein